MGEQATEKEKKEEKKKVLFHALSETEKTKLMIERMMKNPEKALESTENKLEIINKSKKTDEVNPHVQGSSAGAGSGEFHVYRAQRRREYGRLAAMESEKRKEKEEAEYKSKIEAIRRQEQEKTDKKRAKRHKRKNIKEKKGAEDKIDNVNEKKYKMTANINALEHAKEIRNESESKEEI